MFNAMFYGLGVQLVHPGHSTSCKNLRFSEVMRVERGALVIILFCAL